MRLKEGVQAISPHPAIVHAMELVDLYWRATFGVEATITSIRDGRHGTRSYHYGRPGDIREMAFDVRTRDLTPAEAARAVADLLELLGSSFDIILESDHIHIERDISDLLKTIEAKDA